MFKKLTIGLIVVAFFCAIGFAFSRPASFSSASAKHDNIESFFGGLRSHVIVGLGGIQTIASSSATTTITAAQICSGDIIQWNPTTSNATATFDNTANIVNNCLNAIGNAVKVRIMNTAATNTFSVVAATNETIYHVAEAATTTAQGTTVTSSTPVTYEFVVTLVTATTTQSSTIALWQNKYLTP